MALASQLGAADYQREERWAQEVVPSIVVGDPIYLVTPTRAKVLALVAAPNRDAKGAVVLVHGIGVHPDFGLIGSTRTKLVDAGFLTLSVQMPVLAAGVGRDDYRSTFPEAGERISAAIAYLRQKRIAKIAIVSHSMGAAMVNAYLAQANAEQIDAWVPIGMSESFVSPPKAPVLDIVADSDLPEVKAAAPKRLARIPGDGCSKQITIGGTDHYFDSRLMELATTIATFLERVFEQRC